MRSAMKGNNHLGKEITKFQFDVHVDKIQGIHSGLHAIKWTRGTKTMYTKPFQREAKSRDFLPIEQKMSLLTSLCREKSGTTHLPYEAKDAKLSLVLLRDAKHGEKTVGKVHFNIAEYVGVPCAEASVVFKLNGKTSVHVRIVCTFVRIAKGAESSFGTMSGRSMSAGELENRNDDFVQNEEYNQFQRVLSPMTPQRSDVVKEEKDALQDKERCNHPELARLEQLTSLKSGSTNSSGHRGSPSSISTPQAKKRSLRGLSYVGSSKMVKNKAKVATLESENGELRKQLLNAQKEIERRSEHHRLGKDNVVKLQRALATAQSDVEELKQSRDEVAEAKISLIKEMDTIRRNANQTVDEQRERVRELQLQVEHLESTKAQSERDYGNRQATVTEQQAVPCDILTSATPESSDVSFVSGLGTSLDARDRLNQELSLERKARELLDKKCVFLSDTVSQLKARMKAYEKRSSSVKETYGGPSKMYSSQHVANLSARALSAEVDHEKMKEELRHAKQRLQSQSLLAATASQESEGLRGALEALQAEVLQKQECIASLRGELAKTKSELETSTAASAADSSRTQLEVSEALSREQVYKEDICRKNELIESLTSRLSEVVNEREAAIALSQSKLIACQEREQACQEELSTLKERTANLNSELRSIRVRDADNSARVQSEAFEAQSREQSFRTDGVMVKEKLLVLEKELCETKEREDKLEIELATARRKVENAEREVLAAKTELGVTKESEEQLGTELAAARQKAKESERDAIAAKKDAEETLEAAANMRANQAMAEVLGMGTGAFVSSSYIREHNVLEKITDLELLKVLVDTKMKLALAEEEKLQLEHLLRRIGEGDKNVQQLLSEHAAKVEADLAEANLAKANFAEADKMAETTQAEKGTSKRCSKGKRKGKGKLDGNRSLKRERGFESEEHMRKLQNLRNGSASQPGSKTATSDPKVTCGDVPTPSGDFDVGNDPQDTRGPLNVSA